MAAGIQTGSAEIVQFPVTNRRRNFAPRAENMDANVVNFPERSTYAVVDTCWYHADAISDADKPHN